LFFHADMSDSVENPVKRRRIAIFILVLSLVVAIGLGWKYFARVYNEPLSEDAVLTARVARIAASVPGRVNFLGVEENSTVKAGQLLFTLDPEVYTLQVEQARAAHQVAEAALQTRLRGIAAETANVTIADEQIQRAKINAAQASQTLKRLQGLAPKGYVTAQQVDDARTIQRNTETTLREALAQQEAAQSLVGTADAEIAMVEQTRALLAVAERQLRDTEVRAPNDGRIAGLAIAVGDYMLPAQSAFSLIDTTKWYASAGYLETELSDVRPGMCATVYVAEDRSRIVKGLVDSIGWGVISGDEIPIPRNLPYVPKTLNWVRVGQRFPVRILLDSPPQDIMRVGASATVIVHSDEKC
jgi:multidrug efflux system membrane fusion protein